MEWEITRTPRTLRHRGVKDDERRVSHNGNTRKREGKKKVAAAEPPVCRFR